MGGLGAVCRAVNCDAAPGLLEANRPTACRRRDGGCSGSSPRADGAGCGGSNRLPDLAERGVTLPLFEQKLELDTTGPRCKKKSCSAGPSKAATTGERGGAARPYLGARVGAAGRPRRDRPCRHHRAGVGHRAVGRHRRRALPRRRRLRICRPRTIRPSSTRPQRLCTPHGRIERPLSPRPNARKRKRLPEPSIKRSTRPACGCAP